MRSLIESDLSSGHSAPVTQHLAKEHYVKRTQVSKLSDAHLKSDHKPWQCHTAFFLKLFVGVFRRQLGGVEIVFASRQTW